MISNFEEEAQDILIKAKLEMLELRHPYVGTEHLVLSILHSQNEISSKLSTYDLTYNNFKSQIINIIGKGTKKSELFLYTPLLKKVIENAIMDSKDNNNGIVTINHLFSALLDVGEGIAIRIFMGMNLDLDNMYDEFTSKVYEPNSKKKHKTIVESLGTNLNEQAKNNQTDPVIERDAEIRTILEILCRRTKNNPLLIGAPGVGKTAIVEELAKNINDNKVPKQLQNKKIISLDMASAVAGTKYRGEFEERMKKIIEEIEQNDHIILFIDEIHTLIGAGGAEGAIDASNILKPALARGKIKCIGATTIDEYKKSIEKDKALNRRFQIITIEEPSIEKTKDIIKNLKPTYEKYHNVIIDEEIIDAIVNLSEKYIYNRYRPDKQIDILDEVCSKVSIDTNDFNVDNHKNLKEITTKKEMYIKENNIKKAYEYKIKEVKCHEEINRKNNKRNVLIKDVAHVISKRTTIPIYEILKDQKKTINNIQTILEKTIIGQEKAISNLVNISKRIKLGYKENKCISLLFVGTSGVGKTKLAYTYGELTTKKVIKLDMSEYSDITSINKFLGSNPGYIGYDDNKHVLETIRDNPTATIILDEIDKAHPNIINLLYQMLDEGKITDSKNNIINLQNNIIIMTSNKGTEKKEIGFNKNKDKVLYELKETFNVALLNRIDNIIIFEDLNEQAIKTIIEKEIKKIKDKYKNATINISKNVLKEIMDESNYKEYGARKIEKIINNKLENIIIDSLINNNTSIVIDSILSK